MDKLYIGIPEVKEEQATGSLKILYEDIKLVLKVPLVNFIFRAMALYEPFLQLTWRQTRPNLLTVNFEKAAEKIRAPQLNYTIPEINWRKEYDLDTLEEIREIILIFRYVNTKLLVMSSGWVESLSNRDIWGSGHPEGAVLPGVNSSQMKIPLMDPNEAPLQIKALLLDIAERHQAMDVNSDFRALAYYPGFLETTWQYLSPYTQTSTYQALRGKLTTQAIDLARELPYPIAINRFMYELNLTPQEVLGIKAVLFMFRGVIPGLIIDCEFFKQILEKGLSLN